MYPASCAYLVELFSLFQRYLLEGTVTAEVLWSGNRREDKTEETQAFQEQQISSVRMNRPDRNRTLDLPLRR
jgi:hypothetical protein